MKRSAANINPYPGIRSFNSDESGLFFGRESQIKELKKTLRKNRFAAITGASGSGKSSLVKAGLLPALKKENPNLIFQIMRPGTQALQSLAGLCADLFKQVKPTEEHSRTALFKQLSESAAVIKDELLAGDSKHHFCIYIDQFEEIFHDKKEASQKEQNEQKQFINALLNLISDAGRLDIIISLRTDFLGDCSKYPNLAKKINTGHYLIPEMTADEKERAIREPARKAGADISEELMQQLRNDFKKKYVSLPVMQHALMRTWEYRSMKGQLDGDVLPEHYKAVGTVENALSVHAEEIFGGIESERGRFIAEKIFKTLAFIGKENRLTRRPTRVKEIAEIARCDKEELIEIVEMFRAEKNSFLLPPPPARLTADSLIDISHESIMPVWKRMQTWIDQESKSARLYLRISRSAALFQEGKTGLLTNPDLDLALKWKKDNRPNETWALRYEPAFDRAMSYLNRSKEEFDTAIKLKDEKQKRELKRTRTIAALLGGAALVLVLFLVIALNMMFKAEASEKDAKEKEKMALQQKRISEEKKKEAVTSRRIAEQQKDIAEQQRLIAEEQKQFAVKKQKEALRQKRIADIAKNKETDARILAERLRKKAEDLKDQALEEKNKAEKQKNRAELSEAKTDTLRRLAIAKSLAAQAVKTDISNKRMKNIDDYRRDLPIVMALQAYFFNKKYNNNRNDPDIFAAMLQIADAEEVLSSENGHKDAVRLTLTSGNKFFSADESGNIFYYENADINNPLILKKYDNKLHGIRAAVFRPEKNELYAADKSGRIFMWNINQTKQKPYLVHKSKSTVAELIATQNPDRVIICFKNGKLKEVIQNKQGVFSLSELSDTKKNITAGSYDKPFIYIGTDDGTILRFNENKFTAAEQVQTEGRITALAAQGAQIVAGYRNGNLLKINKMSVGDKINLHNSAVNKVVFIDSRRIATCSYDGTIKIINSQDISAAPIIINSHADWVYSVASTESGTALISGSADKTVRLTYINSEDLKNALRKKVSANMSKKDWEKYVGKDIKYNKKLPKE